MSGYTISIAEEYEGIIRTSVVYDPEHNELFHAIRGAGAFRNGIQIKTSELGDISQALVSCDWGNKDEKRKEGLEYFKKLMLPFMIARRIIPQFAPANDLVRIAEGRIHVLVCNDTWIEDHAAGSLIVQEAGGYVTNFYDRNDFTHNSPGIIATANKKIWDALCGTLFS